MKPSAFEYACPATINKAVALLAGHGGEAKPLACGQSLVPMMAFRIAQCCDFTGKAGAADLRRPVSSRAR
jgi:carbon-monoxide dehydrogenase medium subunit